MGFLAAMISGGLGSRGLLLLGEIALDALLSRPPTGQGLIALEVSPLNHPNGRVPAHAEYPGYPCGWDPLVRLLHRVLPSKVLMCVERTYHRRSTLAAFNAVVKSLNPIHCDD